MTPTTHKHNELDERTPPILTDTVKRALQQIIGNQPVYIEPQPMPGGPPTELLDKRETVRPRPRWLPNDRIDSV